MRDGTYLIGRSSARAGGRQVIQVDHPTVSELHAELFVLNGRYHLMDLGSSNGTWRRHRKGEERITGSDIGPDDELRLGEVRTTVRDLLARASSPTDRSFA